MSEKQHTEEDKFAPLRHLEGRHVKIIAKDHPWVDYTGRIVGFEIMNVINKPGCIIELDEIPDHRVTIFSGKDIKMI